MRTTSLSVIVGLFFASYLHAGLVSWRSLVDLEQSADLIVVGSHSERSQSGPVVSFTVQVARVVKGEPALVGSIIPVAWTVRSAVSGMSPAASAPGKSNGLWFLQRTSSGWGVLPVMQGNVSLSDTFIPVASGPILDAYAYAPTAALSDKVASEVCAAIEGAGGGAANFYALHVRLLDQLKSPVVQAMYQRMAASVSPKQKILGLSGLIRNGSAGALSSAIGSISLIDNNSPEMGVLLLSIRDVFRVADPSSVSILGQTALVATVPSAMRAAVAHALASIHTVAALPYLASLLDDPDLALRMEAIGGFSAFANGLPAQVPSETATLSYLRLPDSGPYKTSDTIAHFAMGKQAISRNEAMYLSFWKAWWLQHRTELGQ